MTEVVVGFTLDAAGEGVITWDGLLPGGSGLAFRHPCL